MSYFYSIPPLFAPPPPYLFTFVFTFLLPSPYLLSWGFFLLQRPLPCNPMLQNTPSPTLSGRITYTLFRLLVNFDFSFSVNGHLNLSCFIVDLHQTTWVHCQQIFTGLYKQRIRRPLIFIGQTRVILTGGPVLFHCADKQKSSIFPTQRCSTLKDVVKTSQMTTTFVKLNAIFIAAWSKCKEFEMVTNSYSWVYTWYN